MKTLNVTFEDEEYDDLLLTKGKTLSWHDFIMQLVKDNKKNSNSNQQKKNNDLNLFDTDFDIDKETSLL